MAIEDDDVVKSVGRVFEVLELFDRRREVLNAKQVERLLRYPQSSTLALLKSMVKLGYLSFDRIARTYLPTMRVASLGHWLETAFHGEGRLAALLQEVSARTSETVCLSCQNDLVMQFTHVRLGPQSHSLRIKPGEFAPLFRSAIGTVALSERPQHEVQRLLQRHNRRARNPALKVEPSQAFERIRKTHQCGYAVGYDLYLPGVGAIAWLLKPEDKGPTVVLSVGGPSDRIKNRETSIVRTTRAAMDTHLRA
jgi:DNA-binding IclR family transcriptional regulator